MYISNIEDKRRNWNILQGGGGNFHLRKRKRATFDFFWLKLPLSHSLPFLGKLVAPFFKITKINRKYDKTVELWVKGNLTVISEVTCRDSEPNQCKYIFISLQNTMSSLIEFKQRKICIFCIYVHIKKDNERVPLWIVLAALENNLAHILSHE